MFWHYVAVKVKDDYGEDEYTVGECFPALMDSEISSVLPYTESTHFSSDTVEGLVRWLRTAADDIEKYGCVNEKNTEKPL